MLYYIIKINSNVKARGTSCNRSVCASPPVGGSGYEKTQSGLRPLCVFSPPHFLCAGIALGSAVSLAADARIDNRIMFTVGKAAAALGLLGEYKMVIGIPLSVSAKTPFFDREPI